MPVILILVLILIVMLGVFRAMLRGTLNLTLVRGSEGTVVLPARPWKLLPAENLIGVAGWIFIAGIPFTHKMHIWIRCPGRPNGGGTVRPGGRRYISGVWVTHDTTVRQDDLSYGPDPDVPELWTYEGSVGGNDDRSGLPPS